jgi:hypothetical protein
MKTILLASTAAALLAATAGQASEIRGTGAYTAVTSSASGATATANAYKLANEIRFSSAYTTASSAAASKGFITYNFSSTNAGGFTNGESLLLTLDVSGAVFDSGTAVIAAYDDGNGANGTCTASISAASAVAAGATSATYFVTLTDCTNTGTGLNIALPIQVTGANDVTAGALLQSSFGGQLFNVDGGRASALFITSVDAFQATVNTASPLTAEVSATGGAYTQFVGGSASGTVVSATVTVDTASFVTVATSATAGTSASAASIDDVRVRLAAASGSFVGYTVTGTATNGTIATASSSSTATGTTVVYDPTAASSGVTFTVNDVTTGSGNVAIPVTSANITVDVDLAPTADTTFGTSGTGQLVDFTVSGSRGIINRNGTSFVAPWVALGSASASSSIRLGNNGGAATGLITVSLLSDTSVNAPTTSSVVVTQSMLQAGTLNANGGINPGDVVTISGAALRTAFGTDAANGDVSVSIEAPSGTLSGKVRVTQASGQILETSLGLIN